MSLEQTIVDINRKLDKMAKPAPFWVNAETVMKMTGLDSNGMNALRKNNPDWYKVSKSGGYLYNLHCIPEVMIINRQMIDQ